MYCYPVRIPRSRIFREFQYLDELRRPKAQPRDHEGPFVLDIVRFEDQRRHPRLYYPVEPRPTILFEDAIWPLADISVGGVAFCTRDMRYRMYQSLFGFLHFHDNAVQAVEGDICRLTIDRVIMQLTRTIPEARIIHEREQLALSQKRTKSRARR